MEEEYNFEVSGTYFQKEIMTAYDKIKSVFGMPIKGMDMGKVDAQWEIKTPYGMGTIYNYKDGKNYLGREGMPKTKITNWHIGGHNIETALYIEIKLLK